MHICIFFHFTPGIIWTLSGNLTKGCCYILHLDGERFQYLILISVYIVQLATLSLAPFIYEFSFYVLSIFIIDNFLFLALWSYWMWFLLEKKKKKEKENISLLYWMPFLLLSLYWEQVSNANIIFHCQHPTLHGFFLAPIETLITTAVDVLLLLLTVKVK